MTSENEFPTEPRLKWNDEPARCCSCGEGLRSRVARRDQRDLLALLERCEALGIDLAVDDAGRLAVDGEERELGAIARELGAHEAAIVALLRNAP